jgi:hypothetical protein
MAIDFRMVKVKLATWVDSVSFLFSMYLSC